MFDSKQVWSFGVEIKEKIAIQLMLDGKFGWLELQVENHASRSSDFTSHHLSAMYQDVHLHCETNSIPIPTNPKIQIPTKHHQTKPWLRTMGWYFPIQLGLSSRQWPLKVTYCETESAPGGPAPVAKSKADHTFMTLAELFPVLACIGSKVSVQFMFCLHHMGMAQNPGTPGEHQNSW